MTDIDRLAAGVRSGDHTALGRAITLVESSNADHRHLADALLEQLLPHAGGSHRVGITGMPGAGKSTFIDAMGSLLTGEGQRVGVLAVDPTSTRTGGSILGDKTRMARLATDPAAFIRPSPSAGALGGVTRSTREAVLVLEAAGFDTVLVETVGVGQSETIVHAMVDCFVVLTISGAGDELQGIKRGVLELADLLAVNKADGERVGAAELAAATYRRALHLFEPVSENWAPPVVTCSALSGDGLAGLWAHVVRHREITEASGERDRRRRSQQVAWMGELLNERLLARITSDPDLARHRAQLEDRVAAGTITAPRAVDELLDSVESL